MFRAITTSSPNGPSESDDGTYSHTHQIANGKCVDFHPGRPGCLNISQNFKLLCTFQSECKKRKQKSTKSLKSLLVVADGAGVLWDVAPPVKTDNAIFIFILNFGVADIYI